MNATLATKTPRIATEAGEPMGPFVVGNCLVPRRFTARIEKFLHDNRTGNIQINIKDGKILGIHVNEFLSVQPAAKSAAGNGTRRRP